MRRRWSIYALAIVIALLGTVCGDSPYTPTSASGGSASTAAPASALTTASPSAVPLASRCSDATHGMSFDTVTLHAADGIELYAAVAGSGRVGLVLANDIPHPICEEIAPAVALVRWGYRVMVFDYRDHGYSAVADERGRLGLDVAAAATALRDLGSSSIVLLGSYAGAAACLVAATSIRPPVDAVVGLSPTAIRGQYVEGPFDPIGPLQAAARLRIPALFVTAERDSFVPVSEARWVYAAITSSEKRLIVVPEGFPGWYLLERRTLRDVVTFIDAET